MAASGIPRNTWKQSAKGPDAPPEPLPVNALPPEVQAGIADLRAKFPKELADYSDETIAGFIQQQRAKFLKGQMRATLRKSFKKSSAPPETMPPTQGTPSPQGSSPTSSPTGANEAAAAASPVQSAVESAGGVYRGKNSAGLVEITLPRSMTDTLPIREDLKNFVSITMRESEVTPESVKSRMQAKADAVAGKTAPEGALARPRPPDEMRRTVNVLKKQQLRDLEAKLTRIPEIPRPTNPRDLLVNPELADKAVDVGLPEKAIPIGGARKSGAITTATDRVQANKIAAQLHGKEGFPDVRIVQVGPGGFEVQWGAEMPQRSAGTPTPEWAQKSGEAFGYKPEQVSGMTEALKKTSSASVARRSLLSRQAAPSAEPIAAGNRVRFSGGRTGTVEAYVADKDAYIVRNDRTKGTHFVRANEIKKLGK